jgi:hypothetical protein
MFDNAYWFKANGSSVTSNSTTAPNGTLTADTLNVSTTAYSTIYNQSPFGFVNGVYTQTIYAKKSTKNWLYILDLAGSGAKAWFNLDTGVVGTVAIGYTASMESVGNGWYRCLLSQNINPALYYQFGASDADNSFTPSSSGSIYIWGAQLELGSPASTYQAITTTQQAYISNQFKYNLVNPVDSDAAFRLVFNGGWTHSSNGATPNGTNGYADTKLVPSSSLSTSSAHFAKYNRTNDLVGLKLDGASVTGVGTETFFQHNYTTANGIIGEATSIGVYTATDTRGLFNATRTSLSAFKVFRNTSNIASSTNAITVLPNRNVFLGARNDNSAIAFYNTYQAAFASIGDGLTDTDASNLYSRVNTFQVALSRNV